MNPLLITGFGTSINVDKRKLIITNSHNFKIPAVLLMTTIIAMLSGVFVFDMANAEQNDLDEIADKIQSDSRFEEFPPHVLDAIRAGEIDEYSILMVISKAPQDVGSYGSRTNVVKLTEIIENEMGLEIGGSDDADISILAPVEVLVEFAKYPYVERIIGKDFGIKYSNEDKTEGIIKYDYEGNLYDISYSVTNARIVHFTNFGFEIKFEKEGILQMTYPIEFTDKIVNIYDNSNATLTSIIEDAGNTVDRYEIIKLNDKQIKFQWDFVPTNNIGVQGLYFYTSVTTGSSESIIEDVRNDDSYNLPTWIKNNAGWWADGKLTDSDFMMGIEYLIEKGIMII